ncbi:MAG: DUF2961 domain-containing protein [Phycisphaerae bacterium]|jgi:hypothetical protein
MLAKNIISACKPFPGPGELRCDQTQRNSVAAGQWETIFNISDGPCIVTNLWFACDFLGKLRVTPIRIYFDGAASPQIEGLTGEIFACGFDFPANHRGDFTGVTNSQESGEGTGYNGFSGYLRMLMPYYSSIRIDIKNETTSSHLVWMMLERMPMTRDRLASIGLQDGMLLRTFGYGQANWRTKYTEVPLLDTNEPTIIAGLFHFFNNGLGSGVGYNFKYLEGDYKIYYGGSAAASYRSSGTEDFYHSSWYFQEGNFDQPGDECMVEKHDTQYTCSASRFFPLWRAPYHKNGIKLTWRVGEPEMPDPGNTYTRWLTWHYK